MEAGFSEGNWEGSEAIAKKSLLHVVKDCSCRGEGEALSSSISLSELDLMPIFEIVNVDDDVEDQQHLHNNIIIIPSAISGFAQACHLDGNQLHKIASHFGLHGRQWNQILTTPLPASCQLPLAKTTGCFLLLVPLVAALCIRCIVAAFQNRVARKLRHQPAHHRGSNENRMRWKTVLSDLQDPEAEAALGAESNPNLSLLMEEEEQLRFEDMSHAYTKLEDEYHKFLSECGMSKWGYWRGGSGSGSAQ